MEKKNSMPTGYNFTQKREINHKESNFTEQRYCENLMDAESHMLNSLQE